MHGNATRCDGSRLWIIAAMTIPLAVSVTWKLLFGC